MTIDQTLAFSLIVDKHRRYTLKMASSVFAQNGTKSVLFSSEKSDQSVPFSYVPSKAIYEHTAGDEIVGLETDNENLEENLDGLSEEQLDELLREARDINQRLRSVERKQNMLAQRESLADREMAMESMEESASRPSRSYFLPPIHQTKTAMVTQVNVMEGIVSSKAGRLGRREKSTVT